MNSNLKIIKLFMFYLITFSVYIVNTAAFASKAPSVINYKTNDFSISFPNSFNFTKKEILSGTNNSYLFADHEKLKTTNNKPSRFHEGLDIADNEPNVLVYVESLPNISKEKFDFNNPNVIINSECTYIAMLNADTRSSLNFSVDKKDFLLAHKNCETVAINGNKFQKYKLKLPKISVTYFAFISHKKMFIVEMISILDKQAFLNDKNILDILKTFTPQ
jgi:hypothetical protein